MAAGCPTILGRPGWGIQSEIAGRYVTDIVDITGFTDRSWLDAAGHPRSDSMHITERYPRRDFGHMDLEMTFEEVARRQWRCPAVLR